MNKNIPIKSIIDLISSEIIKIYGNTENIYINGISPFYEINNYTTLDWINSNKLDKQVIAEKSDAHIIICDSSIVYSNIIEEQLKTLIIVRNPRKCIALIVDKFFVKKPDSGIHKSAVIHPEAIISKHAHIGPGCVIGKCTINRGTIINPNVTIYDGTNIGSNVVIQAGAIIGTDGLGCERDIDGTLIKFPHLGNVIIEDNVEIGANCQIARGSLSDTIIKRGTKINGLCFIAHNCEIGENVWITGNTMLAGSVKVEKNVTIYSNVVIREQTKIGKNAIVGMGSVVTKNIPAGETWIGNPAKKLTK